IALALLHVHEAPPSLSVIRADITAALDQVVDKGLAKDPANRFQTASEFSTAFAAAVLASTAQSLSIRFDDEYSGDGVDDEFHSLRDEQPIFAVDKPNSYVKPVQPAAQRHRRLLVFILTTCLVIAGTVGFSFNAVTGGLA